MPQAVEVELLGGIADGKVCAVQGDLAGMPPSAMELSVLNSTDPLDVRTVTYRREVSPKDDGPLWRYVLAP